MYKNALAFIALVTISIGASAGEKKRLDYKCRALIQQSTRTILEKTFEGPEKENGISNNVDMSFDGNDLELLFYFTTLGFYGYIGDPEKYETARYALYPKATGVNGQRLAEGEQSAKNGHLPKHYAIRQFFKLNNEPYTLRLICENLSLSR